jgi:hypothetical protein
MRNSQAKGAPRAHVASGDDVSSEAFFVPLDTLVIPPKSNRRFIDNVPIPATLGVAVSRALDSHPFVPSGPLAASHRILFIGRSAQSEARCRTSPHQTPLRANNSRCGARHNFSPCFLYAAFSARSRCQRRSRFQQISASFLAAATRAIFALERFRTRV